MFSTPEIIFLAILFAGVIDLALGCFFLGRANTLARHGQKTQATIKGYEARNGHNMPILSYRGFKGQLCQRTAPFILDAKTHPEGSLLSIIYLPENPKQIMRDGGINPQKMLGLACISGVFGIGVMLVVLVHMGIAVIPAL